MVLYTEEQISSTSQSIDNLKKQLREERLRLQQRSQYEILAREIQKVPTKEATQTYVLTHYRISALGWRFEDCHFIIHDMQLHHEVIV